MENKGSIINYKGHLGSVLSNSTCAQNVTDGILTALRAPTWNKAHAGDSDHRLGILGGKRLQS